MPSSEINPQNQRRVLVLDADMVSALTIARSLTRHGYLVDIAGHTQAPISVFSRATAEYFRYPDPLEEAGSFVAWLAGHLREKPYDLVIPVTERTLLPLSRSRDQLGQVRIAMPAEESLEIVLDKSRTLALAREVDVPVPRGVLVRSPADLEQALPELDYPVVLKPVRSISSGHGGTSQLKVSYAFDQWELRAGCSDALRFGAVLLQEYFAGDGVGVELIAQCGEIVYAFQHRRFHEVPLTGGGSSLRKSEPVSPQLLAASERLISALGWTGVAMVEYKFNAESRDYRLMEINGRFWGSLPLAVVSGADFPAMLADLELDGRVGDYPAYREGIYCRLLSKDLHWHEAVIRSDVDSRLVQVPSKWHILRDMILFLSPRHYFDVQSLRDPIPGLVDIARILQTYTGRIVSLLEEKIFLLRQRRAWDRGHVESCLKTASSMLILCYGNINRSALADVLVRGYAEDSGIAVVSAGFHPRPGRPADPMMVEIAEEFGQDMSSLRSSCVSPEQLQRSDVIFVMEKSHYDRVVETDPGLADRIFLLGARRNHADWPSEIADPFGHSSTQYRACYERIADAVDNLKAIISTRAID